MLGLRRDCTLVVEGDNTYIRIDNGYSVPIAWNMAFLLSLMDGTRTQADSVEVSVELGLLSNAKRKKLLNDFERMYSVYLETYSDEYVRTDMPSSATFLKQNQPEFDAFNCPLPKAMLYHVTSSCDKACRYCYLDAKHTPLEKDILTKNELFNIIEQLGKLGAAEIIYTGGEPFVRPDLMEIIQHASECGIWNIVTTKHYFSEEDAKRIGEIGRVKISLSYDCHIDSIADFLSGMNGHVQKMDRSIQRLLVQGVKLSIEPVVTGMTAELMHDFLLHLKGLGVEEVNFHRYFTSEGRQDDRLTLTSEQWDNIVKITESGLLPDLNIFEEVIERISGEVDAPLCTGCVNALKSISVLPNGKVVLCDHMPNALRYCYGDLKTQSVEEIWNGELRQEISHPPQSRFSGTPCGSCDLFETCLKKTACWKQSVLEHGDAFRPSSMTHRLCARYRDESSKKPIAAQA